MTENDASTTDHGGYRMKRGFTLIAFVILLAPTAFAQHDDYKKWEFFGGYSALGFDTLAGDTDIAAVNDVLSGRNTLRGFELSVTRNFHRYWGVKGDYSLGLREDNFTRPLASGTEEASDRTCDAHKSRTMR